MIAVDSSVVIRWLNGVRHPACDALDSALARFAVRLPPAALAEVLSARTIEPAAAAFLATVPVLPVYDGYWARAGALRGAVRRQGRKAALGDALVAQSCIDADIPLLAVDSDFAVYADLGGLRLVAL